MTGNGHIAKHTSGQKGLMERSCKARSDSGQTTAQGKGLNKARGSGAMEQAGFKYGQPGKFARVLKQEGQGSSVAVQQLQLRGRPHCGYIVN